MKTSYSDLSEMLLKYREAVSGFLPVTSLISMPIEGISASESLKSILDNLAIEARPNFGGGLDAAKIAKEFSSGMDVDGLLSNNLKSVIDNVSSITSFGLLTDEKLSLIKNSMSFSMKENLINIPMDSFIAMDTQEILSTLENITGVARINDLIDQASLLGFDVAQPLEYSNLYSQDMIIDNNSDLQAFQNNESTNEICDADSEQKSEDIKWIAIATIASFIVAVTLIQTGVLKQYKNPNAMLLSIQILVWLGVLRKFRPQLNIGNTDHMISWLLGFSATL